MGDPIEVTIAAAADSLCNGNTTSITIQPMGNETYAYEWSTGATTAEITGAGVGTYAVTITNNEGCTLIENYELFAGTADACNSTSVSAAAEHKITVYPNPLGETLYVKMEGISAVVLEVWSVTGQRLLTARLNDFDNQLNINNLKSGVFVVIVKNEDGRVLKIERVVKHH